MNASTSAASHTVTDGPSLNGLGNLPSRTQRQMVAGLAGRMPSLSLVVAISETRITLFAIEHPMKTFRNAVCVAMG